MVLNKTTIVLLSEVACIIIEIIASKYGNGRVTKFQQISSKSRPQTHQIIKKNSAGEYYEIIAPGARFGKIENLAKRNFCQFQSFFHLGSPKKGCTRTVLPVVQPQIKTSINHRHLCPAKTIHRPII